MEGNARVSWNDDPTTVGRARFEACLPCTCCLILGKPLNLSELYKQGVITPASWGSLQDGIT